MKKTIKTKKQPVLDAAKKQCKIFGLPMPDQIIGKTVLINILPIKQQTGTAVKIGSNKDINTAIKRRNGWIQIAQVIGVSLFNEGGSLILSSKLEDRAMLLLPQLKEKTDEVANWFLCFVSLNTAQNQLEQWHLKTQLTWL